MPKALLVAAFSLHLLSGDGDQARGGGSLNVLADCGAAPHLCQPTRSSDSKTGGNSLLRNIASDDGRGIWL